MAQDYTADNFAQLAMNLGLIDNRQLRHVWTELGTEDVDADQLIQTLLRLGYLTNFQVERMLSGERNTFFYGDYKILYLAGMGTFARVFRAVHKDNGRPAAVKVLRSRFSDQPDTYQQFLHEGEIGTTLRHPNIVPIFEVYSKGRTHFLAMEFVEGQNLHEFIKIRKKFSPLETAKIMADVCAGLSYAAEKGLHHRDLKLSNVLVSAQGRSKLVDFGMASIAEHLATHTHGNEVDNQTARTVDYAALERITHVPRNDTRSDIYFVGCMMYHLMTGVSPLFETRDRAKRMSRHRFENIKPLQEIDSTLPSSNVLICNRAMSLDPEKRYQTIDQMHTDLKQAVERIEAGDTGEFTHSDDPLAARNAGPIPAGAVPKNKYTVMIVDSDPQMQNVFREGFKKAGYRVLVISDAYRAVDRLRDEPDLADFVIFNAQLLGKRAVKAFNRLTEDRATMTIPALLLLDENQRGWAKECTVAKHRLIVGMPVTMKGLRTTMAKMLERAANQN